MGRAARRLVVLSMLVAPIIALAPDRALAVTAKLSPNGQFDFTYGSTVKVGGPGTAYKPESKLFFTGDGVDEPVRWWGVLGTSGPTPDPGLWLWELVDHVWTARIQLPGADPWAKADTVYEAGTLLVSTRDNKGSVTGNPRESDLYEIPYLGAGAWGPVSGPYRITTASPEVLTIARDSLGRIWASYEGGTKIKVGYTAPFGTSFTFVTVSRSNVATDDVSAITAFAGTRIGVFWSDQQTKQDFFAWRSDLAPVTDPWTVETAFGGGVGGCPTATSDLCADDHMNVKVYQDQVYVAVKTSLNDVSPTPTDPQIELLRRTGDGTWSAFQVSPVSQLATRPVVVLSPEQDAIWVWATRGNEVDVWQSSFTVPSFDSAAYVPWIKVPRLSVSDATSTKQVATSSTGVVVEASGAGKYQYWHNEFPPSG